MNIQAMSHSRARGYWSRVFGLTPEDFSSSGLKVVPHTARLADYHGIYALEHGTGLSLSAPSALLEVVSDRMNALRPNALRLETLRIVLNDLLEHAVGPAYQGYLEPDDFQPFVLKQVRRLTPTETPFLYHLKEACGETAWTHSGLALEDKDLYGCFVGGELVSAGKAIFWSEDTVNPGVVTRPSHRKRGYGAGVVSAVVEQSLEQGHLVVYQTLLSNKAALSVAARLGFREYGQSLALRLRTDVEPS